MTIIYNSDSPYCWLKWYHIDESDKGSYESATSEILDYTNV